MKDIFMFLLGYIISYLLFYWCYKKLNIKNKMAGKTKEKIICFLILFIIGMVSVSISDNFAFLLNYHYLILGLFLAPIVAFTPFAVNNKRKN